MPQIKDITFLLEQLAPPIYQENYDNSGLLVGDPSQEVHGIIFSLDATEAVVEEALSKGCNLIIAHHPIVFKGLKRLTGRTYVERTILKAIKADVAIYAIHTNLDNVQNGVNYKIAQKIGLEEVRILAPKTQRLRKLTTFVPPENTSEVLAALGEAGAGQIGEYKNCSFQTTGKGRFQPTEAANPHIGAANKPEEVEENRIEVLFPLHLQPKVMAALRASHPYEEVAYYLYPLENENQEVGSGAIGELPEAMSERLFLAYLKEKMNLSVIRHTPLSAEKEVRIIALCGGAGSFLLPSAIRQGADVFVSADFKYHEFFDADAKILIADIGHYESEVFTKELLHDYLAPSLPSVKLFLSDIVTNPVQYFR